MSSLNKINHCQRTATHSTRGLHNFFNDQFLSTPHDDEQMYRWKCSTCSKPVVSVAVQRCFPISATSTKTSSTSTCDKVRLIAICSLTPYQHAARLYIHGGPNSTWTRSRSLHQTVT